MFYFKDAWWDQDQPWPCCTSKKAIDSSNS